MTTVASFRSSPLLLLALAVALGLTACTSEPADDASGDAAASSDTTEAAAEWTPLFDGESFAGWTGLGRDAVPEGHWTIEDGTLRKVASGQVPAAADGQPLEGGDLMTVETYRDFELAFEWKVSEGGNSGVKYNVSESLSTAHDPPYAALGFEYQVLDDERHPDGEDPTHRTGALYDLIAADAAAKQVHPPGEWNQSRIVLRGSRGEHWLNGQRVVAYDVSTAQFDSLMTASKYAPIDGFADRRAGHIVLQDHSDDVWYRNIRIRTFD